MQILLKRQNDTQFETFQIWSINILRVILAGVFTLAGSMKLSGTPDMVALFDNIAAGQWLRYFTGFMEVGAGLLLLFRRTFFLGVVAFLGVIAGATLTHLAIIGGSLIPAVILGALLCFTLLMSKS